MLPSDNGPAGGATPARIATRRRALKQLTAFLAGSPLLVGQLDPFRDHSRVPWIDELVTAFDFEPVAYARVPRAAYNYTAYGSETEFTLRRNRQAFEWVEIVPKTPIDIAKVDTAIELFGAKLAYPILVAPTAGHSALHPEGEAATYRGASGAAGTPMIVSNNASMPVDQIAAASKGRFWWQMYPRQDLTTTRTLLNTALSNNAQAIVVTIDQQAGYWERSLHDRNLTRLPTVRAGRGPVNTNPYRIGTGRLWYSWSYFDQIRPLIKVPMLAKGILTAEDAKICLEHGIDGIVVSNHGGRGLDYSPSTLESLPEIIEAVQGRVPVLIDGGFRRGSDIFKALALGAKAVCLGRPTRWGLGAYGAPGVQRILEILQKELKVSMAEAGCASVASIDNQRVRTRFS
jgi:4-hydroxymandelate oxidase